MALTFNKTVKYLSIASCLYIAVVASTYASALEIVVPAYFYPSSSGSDWDDMNSAASVVPLTAIMNPNSGPGTSQNSDYTSAVSSLRANGGTVIGYVSSVYADRPIAEVKADIDSYAAWYDIDGIFIDEMSNTSSTSDLDFYEEVYDYIKLTEPTWEVMGNPGINTQEAYLTRPVADRLMNYESFGSNYVGHTPSAWNANYDSSNFVNLLHTLDSNDVPTMEQYIDLAVSRNVGSIYFTDDVLGNPWDRLPTFWDEQVAKVAAVNNFSPGVQETLTNLVPNNSIMIDASRTDWAGLTSYAEDIDGSPLPGPELDYEMLTVANDADNLYFRFEVDETLNGSSSLSNKHNVYIDVDQDRATGFIGAGDFLAIGADYLIQGGKLYAFQGANQEAFTWAFEGDLSANDSTTDDIELAVSLAQIGDPTAFDLLLNAANSTVDDFLPNSAASGVTLGGFYRYEVGVVASILGDYDGNGLVEAADYTLWANSYGALGGPADGNEDGVVDAADYTLWRDAFAASSLATATAVPEPAMLPMLISILFVITLSNNSRVATLATLERHPSLSSQGCRS